MNRVSMFSHFLCLKFYFPSSFFPVDSFHAVNSLFSFQLLLPASIQMVLTPSTTSTLVLKKSPPFATALYVSHPSRLYLHTATTYVN